MRNTPLKAFIKKGNSALKQVLKPEYTAPDLSFINNQVVSDSDSIKNTSLDSNSKMNDDIKNKLSNIPENQRFLYDDMGNLKKQDHGSIDITAEDKLIQKQKEANPLYNVIKSGKGIYDAFSG
tara:strand:- start:324 stop:692 length:369 start_codon:yes stop_codon:yes gene_type:complete